MKALTVMQPWAMLLASGAKAYETRTWRTSHRGPMFIHASQRFSEDLRELCAEEPFRSLLRGAGIVKPAQMPLGALVGTVEIVECVDTEEKIQEILPELDKMVGGGLITLERVKVIMYRPHAKEEEQPDDWSIEIGGSQKVESGQQKIR